MFLLFDLILQVAFVYDIHRTRNSQYTLDKGVVCVSLRQAIFNDSQFDTLLESYQSLAQTTLFTLRLELRCHVIYFLNQTIREGNFGLTEDEVEEEDLDPTIVELCKDLVTYEDLLNQTLQPPEITYLLLFPL